MNMLLPLAFAFSVSLAGHPSAAEEPPSDARVQKAWSYLANDEKSEVTEWFRAEVSYMDLVQNQLIAFVEKTGDRDRGAWPEAASEAPFFDPETHSPAQPIPRKRLDFDDPKAVAGRATFAPNRDPMQRAWIYDWTTGELRITRDERDPELLFANGLLGLPPKSDLAEALLLRLLDDGSQRKTLTAFSHAYTDRTGAVFPGITLFDAWGSGAEMEMPDVDVLGIVHTLLDEWKKWKAPIPGGQQKKIYTKVGDLFVPAYQHRRLREALAANYLRGKAVPNDTFGPNILGFNALWEEANSDPAALIKELPKPKKWEKFLKSLTKKVAKKKKFREKGQARVDWFENERFRVRAKLVWVLKEFGAFERKRLPAPKPKPEKDA